MGGSGVSDALKKQLDQAVEQSLADVQDHVNFTLQRAYFKCSYECFDRRRSQREITECVERCSFPVLQANSVLENEVSRFQERLNRSLMVCQDKLEAKKLLNQAEGLSTDFEQCVETALKEQIKTLPHLAERLRAQMPRETAGN